jgi:LuxR family quorum-sensing system transcriptional regulator CciR
MIVIFGHGAMHRRLNPDAVIDPVVLPARERECLELAGRGKSDWAIGQMLGLRKSSVHNSLERTKKRYGVSHRIQAVVRAAFEGQILLDGSD